MARVTETATLFYPRRSDGSAFSETHPGDEAVAGQRKAANLYVVARFVTRLFLPLSVAAVAFGFLGLAVASGRERPGYLAMIGVGAVMLIAAIVAAKAIARAFVAADDAAGLPVPKDRYADVCRTYIQLSVADDHIAEAEFVSEEFVARVRAVLPRIRRIDAAYLDRLQRMRFSWLSGNVAEWRSHADVVAGMADEVEAILKSVVQP
jgi:hypothetical protein